MNKLQIIGILLLSLCTIPLGMTLFPNAPSHMAPTPVQLPFFIILSVIEALALGAALIFIISGWKIIKGLKGKNRTIFFMAFIAISWSLGSWWIHDRLHASIGEDLTKLLFIEYGFHVTLIIGAMIVAYSFIKLLQKNKL